jgi:hypothetical protein
MRHYSHYWFVQTVEKSLALAYLDPKKQATLSMTPGMTGYRAKLKLLGQHSETTPKEAYHKYIQDANQAYSQRACNSTTVQQAVYDST